MKTTIYMAIAAIAVITACEKEKPCPVQSNPEAAFHSQLQGTYQQVGSKTDLFQEWNYTSSGPVFTIGTDQISDPFNTNYMVVDPGMIYLVNPHQTVNVSFGDTVVFAYQDGDSLKLVKQ